MKKLLLLFGCTFCATVSGQVWTSQADFPATKRDDGVTFTIGNQAYCGTGMTPWFSTLEDFYAFDLTTETWSVSTPLPGGMERQYAVGVSVGFFGYMFGGINGGDYLNDLWRFEPGSGSWTQLTSLPDSGRSGSTGFTLNDTIYIIGGSTSSQSAIADVWAFSVKHGTWQKKNDLPYPIWKASAAAVDTLGYLAFGMTENGSFPEALLEYNPATDTWANLPPYPDGGHTYGSLVSMDSFLLSMGGRDSLGVYSKYLHRYDIKNQTWQQLSSIPDSARKGGMVFTKDEKLYYTTGITASNARLKQTWKCTDALIGNKEFEIFNWQVFPNPVSDKLNVKIDETNLPDNTKLVITDIRGKVWMEQKISVQNLSVDMSALSQGLYFASLKGSGNFGTIKLLKTH